MVLNNEDESVLKPKNYNSHEKIYIIKLLYSLYYILYMVSMIQFMVMTSGDNMQIMNAPESCKLAQHKKQRAFICWRWWEMHREENVRMLLWIYYYPEFITETCWVSAV